MVDISFDKKPICLLIMTSGIPPTGVHIAYFPSNPASNKVIGSPSHCDDRHNASEK